MITCIRTDTGVRSKPEWRKVDLLKAGFRSAANLPQDLTGSRRLLLSLLILLLDTVWCNRKPQALESDRPNFHSWLHTVYVLWL